MNKRYKVILLLISLLLVLVACEENDDQTSEKEKILKEGKKVETLTFDDATSEGTAEETIESTNDDSSNAEMDIIDSDSEAEDDVSNYTSKEIEYARIWLQFGPNQDIDELHVEYISEGTALNPDDETSDVYPEDVIQLSGGRLVDGVITYSGNGDGTINIYAVPKRWDGINPAGKEMYKKIIENTKVESVDVGDNESVIALIEKIKMQD